MFPFIDKISLKVRDKNGVETVTPMNLVDRAQLIVDRQDGLEFVAIMCKGKELGSTEVVEVEKIVEVEKVVEVEKIVEVPAQIKPLDQMTKAEMIALCEDLGIDSSGTKKTISERVEDELSVSD